ncbi:MAG: WD40 repeat domain-containing protein [Planctomycetales bacterium]|nr:WD40 repeat domain-containing protein [Planctomycetales bacterium]
MTALLAPGSLQEWALSSSAIAAVLLAATLFSSTQAFKAVKAEELAQGRLRDVTLAQRDAEAARVQAEENARQLRSQLYLTNISQAQREAEALDYPTALRQLAACPEECREWEWHWASRNLKPDYSCVVDGRELAWFLPDNRRFLTVSDTKGVRDKIHIWNAATGDLIEEIDTPIGPLCMSALHPNSDLVAVGDENGSVSLLSLSSRKVLWTRMQAHGGKVDGIAFDSNGARMATVGWGGKLIVWSAETGEVIYAKETHQQLRCVQFDPTDRYVATACNDDGPVRIWESESGTELNAFDHFGGGARCVAISPDGKYVASGGNSGHIFVRAIPDGDVIRLLSTSEAVWAIAYSPDGRLLVAAGIRGDIFVFESATGQLLRRLHSAQSMTLWMAFSNDSRYLTAFGSMLSQFKTCVFDLSRAASQGDLAIEHLGPAGSVGYSPNGKQLLTSGSGRRIHIFDAATGELLRALYGHTGTIVSTIWSHDGRSIFSQEISGRLMCWDAETGTVKWNSEAVLPTGTALGSEFGGGLAASPDGKYVFAPWTNGTVWVLDASTGALHRRLEGHRGDVNMVRCSPDGIWLATAGTDSKVILWHAETGERRRTFAGHSESVRAVAFSPDGQRIASASQDRNVLIWDTATGKLLITLNGHTDGLWSVAFFASGQRVIATDNNGEKIVWDVNSGHIMIRWKVSRDVSLDIAPGSQTLATLDYPKGQVTLWEIEDPPIETRQLRSVWAEARLVVAVVSKATPLADRQVDAILADESLDDDVRDAALGLIRTLGDDPYALGQLCWEMLASQDRGSMDEGLTWIECARKRVDCDEYALTEALECPCPSPVKAVRRGRRGFGRTGRSCPIENTTQPLERHRRPVAVLLCRQSDLSRPTRTSCLSSPTPRVLQEGG